MEQHSCKEICFYGSEGHCGRTEHEYRVHCEKLFWSGLPQRDKNFKGFFLTDHKDMLKNATEDPDTGRGGEA